MQKLLTIVAAAVVLPWTATAQDTKNFLGRWDMNVTPATGTPYPQWMELLEKDGKIEGRVQPRGGGWRPIVGAKVEALGAHTTDAIDGRRQHVLPGVLLHVIEAPRPVDTT